MTITIEFVEHDLNIIIKALTLRRDTFLRESRLSNLNPFSVAVCERTSKEAESIRTELTGILEHHHHNN